MGGRERKDVGPGHTVDIALKQDQRTGRLTRDGLDRSSPLFEAEDDQVNNFICAGVTPDRMWFRVVDADGRTLDEDALTRARAGAERRLRMKQPSSSSVPRPRSVPAKSRRPPNLPGRPSG